MDSEFTKISQEYITGYLQWRPMEASALGLHDYDGKAPDYSEKSIVNEIARLELTLGKLDGLNTSKLNEIDKYDYEILRSHIMFELFLFKTRKIFAINPMVYARAVDVNVYLKRNYAPLEERVMSAVSILKQVPDILNDAQKNLINSIPRTFIETSIEIAKGNAQFLEGDVVKAVSGVKDAALLNSFNEAKQTAVTAYRDFTKFLEKEKLPKANDDYAMGTENYKKMLLYEEMITLAPERILEIGMDFLHKEKAEFERTAHIINPNKSGKEVFDDIQNEHPTEQSLIPDTKKNLEAIRQFLIDRKIILIPTDVRVSVEETPEYDRALGFAMMDTPGPFELKATEAYYYVTPPDPNWTEKQKDEWLTSFNYYTTDVVSIHEAYPGHYLQFIHLNTSPATKLEKIFGSYAFTEGWAHYAEQMMLEEGFGAEKDSVTAAKYKLAQLSESLLRTSRLCVSVKMHCQGMSVDEATRFFMENCYYEEKPAQSEAKRGTYDAGYLFYTLGKLMILKLREDYKKQEGANYSLQKFNDTMLQYGMPPVPLLRKKILRDEGLWKEVL
jgi:uncharacterized protein (DUF885 family)